MGLIPQEQLDAMSSLASGWVSGTAAAAFSDPNSDGGSQSNQIIEDPMIQNSEDATLIEQLTDWLWSSGNVSESERNDMLEATKFVSEGSEAGNAANKARQGQEKLNTHTSDMTTVNPNTGATKIEESFATAKGAMAVNQTLAGETPGQQEGCDDFGSFFGTMAGALDTAMNKISDGLTWIRDTAGSALSWMWEKMQAVGAKLVSWVKSKFAPDPVAEGEEPAEAPDIAAEAPPGLWERAKAKFAPGTDDTPEDPAEVGSTTPGLMTKMGSTVSDAASAVGGFFTSVGGTIVGGVSSLGTSMSEKVGDLLDGGDEVETKVVQEQENIVVAEKELVSGARALNLNSMKEDPCMRTLMERSASDEAKAAAGI